MTVLEAVEKVLSEADKPLHYQEITDLIVNKGLWTTESNTPYNTVVATLSIDLRDKGNQSHFIKTSRGYYGLRNKQYPGSDVSTPETEDLEEKLSFADAAELILEQSGKPESLHYKIITQKMMDQKLINTESKSPESTLYASIVQENKRLRNAGEKERFELLGSGIIGLKKWLPEGIAGEIYERNEKAREELLKHLKEMDPKEFERVISILLIKMGFVEVETTSYSGDKGIDVRGTLVVGDAIRTSLAVQVKRHDKNIQSPDIQKLRGSLGTHEQGLFITTSDFASGAKVEASRANAVPVGLVNGKLLTKLMIEHRMGIKKHDLWEVVNFSLDDLEKDIQ